jgi:hypothetical protein
MALETTTTSANDVVNDSLIQPTIIPALSERPGLAVRVCREFNGIGQPTKALKIPRVSSYWGSPADRGAGVDDEFDGAEGSAQGNTQFVTDGVTINTPEYCIAHAVTDNVQEDSVIDGAEFLSLITGTMLQVHQLALDDDFCALFSGLSNSVGTTNTDMSIANGLDATHGIIKRGANCDAMEYVLDPEQVANIRTAVLSTNAAAAIYAASADRLINYGRTDGATRGMGRVMTLDGCLVTMSGLCDTDGGGVDVLGAAFCPSTAQNDASGATTFGIGWKRLPRLEQQRQAKGRSTDIVMSMRAGLAELQDGSGTLIETDAPA